MDSARGVWNAPTNVFLSGVTALSQNLTPAEANALNSLGIDVIQSIPARGMTVTGDRTTSQDSIYQFTAVRRLMIFLEQSISRGAQWAVFEANGPALWVASLLEFGRWADSRAPLSRKLSLSAAI
jgi:uncharacterized protein